MPAAATGLMRHADHVGAEPVALPVQVHSDGLHLSGISHPVGPRNVHPGCFEAVLAGTPQHSKSLTPSTSSSSLGWV